MPGIPGRDSFAGESCHTARWPLGDSGWKANDFSGLRVGVIGTGATGVQVIQEIAKTAEELTVFQLAPNWCALLNNGPIGDEETAHNKENAQQIFD